MSSSRGNFLDGVQMLNAYKNVDDRKQPIYTSVAQALANIPSNRRADGLEIDIKISGVWKKYIFQGGIQDSDFIEKEAGIITETDPTVPQHVKNITTQELANFVEAYNKKSTALTITGDVNKVVTITAQDGTILQASFTDNDEASNVDGKVNSLSFDTGTGVLSANVYDEDDGTNVQVTVNLDGRYALSTHTHSNYLEKNGYSLTAQDLKNEIDGKQDKYGRKRVTASRDLNNSDNNKLLIIDGNITLTFPASIAEDFNFNFKVTSGSNLTISNGLKTLMNTEETIVTSLTALEFDFGTCYQYDVNTFIVEGIII